MKHTYFHIKNFKGIEDIRFDFDKKPNNRIYTLVGLNESGKTTILEAIEFFESRVQKTESSALHGYSIKDVHKLIPRSQKANFNGEISIEAGYRLSEEDKNQLKEWLSSELHFDVQGKMPEEFCVNLTFEFHDSGIVDADPSLLYNISIYGKTKRGKHIKELDGENWRKMISFLKSMMPVVLYFPNFLFEFPDRIYLENPPNDGHRERHLFYRNVFQDVLHAVDKHASLEKHVIARVKGENSLLDFSESLESITSQMGTHVSKTVFTQWNRIFKDEVVGKEIEIRAFKEKLEDSAEESRVYFRIRLKEGSEYCSISERSLGFRWFFAFHLFTHYRGFRSGKIKRNILFLFDEPASNLHSSAQSQLLECFKAYSENSSVIYTTHSHHLINPEWLEGAYVVKNSAVSYKGADSIFTPNTRIELYRYREFVADYPDQTTYFQPILDVLDYQPSALEHIPDVVMLEGKNDFYTIKYVKDIIIGKRPKLNFLPGGGSGSLDHSIQLYLGWGRKFIVLLDSDGEGEKQKKRYQEKFGALIDDRIFTLADVDRKWTNLAMENLFTPAELLKMQKSAIPTSQQYNKTHFNRAIQEAFLTENLIGLSKGTIERFKKLVDFCHNKITSS